MAAARQRQHALAHNLALPDDDAGNFCFKLRDCFRQRIERRGLFTFTYQLHGRLTVRVSSTSLGR